MFNTKQILPGLIYTLVAARGFKGIRYTDTLDLLGKFEESEVDEAIDFLVAHDLIRQESSLDTEYDYDLFVVEIDSPDTDWEDFNW